MLGIVGIADVGLALEDGGERFCLLVALGDDVGDVDGEDREHHHAQCCQ